MSVTLSTSYLNASCPSAIRKVKISTTTAFVQPAFTENFIFCVAVASDPALFLFSSLPFTEESRLAQTWPYRV